MAGAAQGGGKKRKPSLEERLVTARNINARMRSISEGASLVLVNLPLSRSMVAAEFVQYTEVLVEGLDRVVMIRGSGREVVTKYA